MKYSLYYIFLLIFLWPYISQGQPNPYDDKVSSVIASKAEGQPVLLTGKVKEWSSSIRFVLEDQTGSITIVSEEENLKLAEGEEVTITGKVQLDEKGRKEILLGTYRKLKFLKDPTNCCKPEKD